MKKTVSVNENDSPVINPADPHLEVHHAPKNELYELGKMLREQCQRSAHGEFKPSKNRPDPLKLMLESEKGRTKKLLPLRHGRMAISPFTFYKGSAYNMAYDLSSTPSSGIMVQACGDAHLCNFGGFATPELNVIFSINDPDQTLPAPWEWDLKRLATSFVIACNNNQLDDITARDVALKCIQSYRKNIAAFSEMKVMELWHHSLGSEMMINKLKDEELRGRGHKKFVMERKKCMAEEIIPQLSHDNSKGSFIRDQQPFIFHWEGHNPGNVHPKVLEVFELYKKSLSPVNSFLLERYQLVDAATKTFGVGSIGLTCWVLLLVSGDGESLFLQAKEARPSVLEPFAGKSIYSNHGQRVINGYKLIQPFRDPFLGWTKGKYRQYFFRQLRDIKVPFRMEIFGKPEMSVFADWCGEALALSHARSGQSALISGYMGKSDRFDEAIADFAFAYMEQNEKDYNAMKNGIRLGKIKVDIEV